MHVCVLCELQANVAARFLVFIYDTYGSGTLQSSAVFSLNAGTNCFPLHSAISPDGLLCQSREQRAWQGCRSTVGVARGRHYYEATVTDEGLCRLGWSTTSATLELGVYVWLVWRGGQDCVPAWSSERQVAQCIVCSLKVPIYLSVPALVDVY